MWEEKETARQWSAGSAAARDVIEGVLGRAGIALDAVVAETLTIRMGDIERIERMIAAAELRRDRIMREIERRRAHGKLELKQAIGMIEEMAGRELARVV